ncbi:sensor histidine kinase [Anaerococcus tetradius]|uniref:histidine kinase n=1 Tax=Anaerococcus tetradius TaxID=33036 RepID=A0A133KIY8_9FIRM|nr:HAMP domain-containing sensor histidine kinase [Anaerococcus tetradius]KWZ79424.1 ATPase/histidine kinase/DNA gyrase B/HSP90 domain protein [Anaerococcus tetradius]
MTSLRNKLIKNFIAGVLSCILIYSILITLLVTFRYSDMLKIIDDKKPNLISEWFIRLNNDENISSNMMWDYLEDLSKQQNVNIKYFDQKGNLVKYIKAIDKDSGENIKSKTYKVFNAEKKQEAGKIAVEYSVDYTTVNRLQDDFRHAVIYAISSSLLIGFLIAIILSTNISKPIININNFTLKIKEGIYGSIDNEDSDIIEISDLQNNINFLSKSLKRQEEIRMRYAQDISHELRTPLTNLKLYIEAIDDGVIEFDQSVAKSLNGEINRLQVLIDGLKDSFNESVEMGKLNLEEVNISRMLEEISNGFMANFLNKNIKLDKNLKADVYMITDKTKLMQVIQNILTNAIKAIDRDGNISIKLTDTNKNVTIEITDDGIGIDEDKLDMIFERFYRIDDSRNTKTNGLGLGLAITKNFVEALNGKIIVKSKLNEGTSFSLIFKK